MKFGANNNQIVESGLCNKVVDLKKYKMAFHLSSSLQQYDTKYLRCTYQTDQTEQLLQVR